MAELKSSRVTEQKSREVELKSRRSVVLQKRQSRGIAEQPQDGRWDTLVDTRLDREEDILQCTWSDYLGRLGNRAY